MFNAETVQKAKTLTTRFVGRTHINNYLVGFRIRMRTRRVDRYRYAEIELNIATEGTVALITFQVMLPKSHRDAHDTCGEIAVWLRTAEKKPEINLPQTEPYVIKMPVGEDVRSGMSIGSIISNGEV